MPASQKAPSSTHETELPCNRDHQEAPWSLSPLSPILVLKNSMLERSFI